MTVFNFSPSDQLIQALTGLGVLIAAGVVLRYVLHYVASRLARPVRERAQDNAVIAVLLAPKVLRRMAQVVPSLVLQIGIGSVPGLPDGWRALIGNVAVALTVFAVMRVLLAVLDEVLERKQPSTGTGALRARSIKSQIQLAKLVVVMAAAVVMVAALIDKSPLIVLSGLGAMSAVLMLVFRDTLLSFTAGVQLSSNDMLRLGDWIEMPQVGADGDVIDIALNTVKVQNFDKTITTIPTWRLVSESYRNWRGMSESGGRRIKRVLLVDATSIAFLSDDQIDTLSSIALLEDYLAEKRNALSSTGAEQAARLGERSRLPANRRRLTNLGTYRAYAHAYLRARPDIRDDATLMVRMLDPTDRGIPLEVYCFASTVDWDRYERIQADVFDHLLAILPEFGLRVFQQPGGYDMQLLAEGRPHHAEDMDADHAGGARVIRH